MQLVNDCVTMYDTMKDKRIGRAEVIEKFGVGPEKVIEVQALIGDSSDNVPGVPGIGVKTAAQLIIEYGDLETLLMRAGEIKQDKRRQTLIDNAEIARISKRLVTLDQNVKLEVPVEDLAVHEPDYKNLVAFLKAMEFSTLTRRVAEKSGIDANEIEADGKLSLGNRGRRSAGFHGRAGGRSLRQERRPVRAAAAAARQGGGRRHARPRRAGGCASCRRQGQQDRPQQIRDGAHARPPESLGAARQGRRRRRDRHRDHRPRPDHRATVRVLARRSADNEACYVPVGHRDGDTKGGKDLFAPEAQLSPEPDPGEGRAEGNPVDAGGPFGSEGRPGSQVRLADFLPARHRRIPL